MIKRFIIAFIFIAVIAGGLIGFNIFRDQAIEQYFATMEQPAVTVSTTTVEAVTWQPTIAALGTASAANGVDLTVETTGIVNEILFNANRRVEAGDLLVRLDDEVQQADLEAAQSQAALDQQMLDRARELQQRGVGSQSSLETAQAAATASASQVAKLEAVLNQKRLRAPFAGTMGIPRIDIGQYVSPGTVVATLQDLERMRVNFTVPEQEFVNLEIGQPVRFGHTDGEMPFEGSIIGIDPKIDPATRLVSVQAEIANAEGKLNPGQFLRVRVELPTEEDIIAVPQTALVTSLYGDYVYRLRSAEESGNEEASATVSEAGGGISSAMAQEAPAEDDPEQFVIEQVFVTPGRRSLGSVEIIEGLAPGDVVVNAGQNRLSNGARVVIDNSVQPVQVGSGDQ